MASVEFADDPGNVAAMLESANDLVDDGEDNKEDDDFAELEQNFQPESMASLYGARLPDTSVAMHKQSECKYATVWRYWNGFCYRNRRPVNSPYSPTYKEDQTGLGLYRDIEGGPEGYDRGLLDHFFAYLTRCKVKPGIFKWVVQFFNGHLKAEYYCRLHRAGDTPVISRAIAVGGLESLALARNNAYKQYANSAEANYEDIQAEVHKTIGNKSIRELVGYILLSSAAFATKFPLQLITFAASFFSSQQICRLGQDHYNQTLCQRYVRHVRYIGPNPEGTECTFIIARRSKTNLGARRQITCYAPHMDPLRDAAAYHGMMWTTRFHGMGECFVEKSLQLNGPWPNFLKYSEYCGIATYC
jgi:hypothetical protein